jgi:hypothetical protein
MGRANPYDMNNRKNAEAIKTVGLEFIEDIAIDEKNPLNALLELERDYEEGDDRVVMERWDTATH